MLGSTFRTSTVHLYKVQYFFIEVPNTYQPPSTMKLLLTVCLAWALLYTAESLRCHTCTNDLCTNTTSVECSATSTACRTTTSVTGTDASVKVEKGCSTLLSCITPINIQTEWSVNRGFTREARNQICCVTDNCNFQTVATPSSVINGKVCPACASSADSMAGICNVTLTCMGAEDSCFSGNTTSISGDVPQFGCMTRNICANQLALNALFDDDPRITCGAPWSIRMSTVLLSFALIAFKVFV
ncbi:uncharacterized protein [Trachinotus anak]|uniref:uncharacterized protein isoform X2 n=1 Tax=Trachinotus anak TaxID=443729 RepID=UPI0039F20BC7